jgi:hypothetical protein
MERRQFQRCRVVLLFVKGTISAIRLKVALEGLGGLDDCLALPVCSNGRDVGSPYQPRDFGPPLSKREHL